MYWIFEQLFIGSWTLNFFIDENVNKVYYVSLFFISKLMGIIHRIFEDACAMSVILKLMAQDGLLKAHVLHPLAPITIMASENLSKLSYQVQ